MKLRFKFVLPINLILVIILGASLAWNGGDWSGTSLACFAPAWMKRHAVVSESRLFVCTDGVTETFDPQERIWGTRELVALLESDEPGDPREVVDRILDRLVQCRGERRQEDEVTMMLAVVA